MDDDDADEIHLGEGQNAVSVVSAMFPGLNSKLVDQVIIDELTKPGTSVVKNAVVDAWHSNLNDALKASKKKIKNVRLSYKMDVDEHTILSQNYPEFNIIFDYSTINPHGFAANSRKLELELLLSKIQYDNVITCNKFDNYDDYVCDIGGNFNYHWNKSNKRIHSCCPILTDYDDIRFSNRMVNMDLTIARESSLTKWQRDAIDQIKTHDADKPFTCDLFCTHRAEKCNRTAKFGIMLHSNYDIPLRKLGDIMERKHIKILYGSFIFVPEVLLENSSGKIQPLGAHYQISKNKNQIKFSFLNDSSLNYTHELPTYLSYVLLTTFYNSSYTAKFYLELLENRLGIQYFKVTRCTLSPMYNVPFNHKLWFSEAEKKVVVKFYKVEEIMGLDVYRSLWENLLPCGTEFLEEEYITYEKELVEGGLSFAFGATEEKFKPLDIFNYLKTQNRKIIFGQRDVLMTGKKDEVLRLVKLSFAIYIYVYEAKYSYGKMNQVIMNQVRFRREFPKKNLLRKFLANPPENTMVVKTWFPGLHRFLHRCKFKSDLGVDIKKHIQFLDLSSGNANICEKFICGTINKIGDGFKDLFTTDGNCITMEISNHNTNNLAFNFKNLLHKVLLENYSIDVDFNNTPSRKDLVPHYDKRDAQTRYFDDHVDDTATELSTLDTISIGKTISVTDPIDHVIKTLNNKRNKSRFLSVMDTVEDGTVPAKPPLEAPIEVSYDAVSDTIPPYIATNKNSTGNIFIDLHGFINNTTTTSLSTNIMTYDICAVHWNVMFVKEISNISLDDNTLKYDEYIKYNILEGSITIYIDLSKFECFCSGLFEYDDYLRDKGESLYRVISVSSCSDRQKSRLQEILLPVIFDNLRIVVVGDAALSIKDDVIIVCGRELLKLVKVPGDGRCLFYALNRGSTDISEMIDTLKNFDYKSPFFVRDEFIREIEFSVWGGMQTILVYSEAFERTVCIHLVNEMQPIKVGNYEDIIHLYYNGAHYDYLDHVITPEMASLIESDPYLTAVQSTSSISSKESANININVECKTVKESSSEYSRSTKPTQPSDCLMDLLIANESNNKNFDTLPFVEVVNNKLNTCDILFHMVHDWTGNYGGFAKEVAQDSGPGEVYKLDTAKLNKNLYEGYICITKGNRFKNIINLVGNATIGLTVLKNFLNLLKEKLDKRNIKVIMRTVAICMGRWGVPPRDVMEVLYSIEIKNLKIIMHVPDASLYKQITDSVSSARSDKTEDLVNLNDNIVSDILRYLNSVKQPYHFSALYKELESIPILQPGTFNNSSSFLKFLKLHNNLFDISIINNQYVIKTKAESASAKKIAEMVSKQRKSKSEKLNKIVEDKPGKNNVAVVKKVYEHIKDVLWSNDDLSDLFPRLSVLVPGIEMYSSGKSEYNKLLADWNIMKKNLKYSESYVYSYMEETIDRLKNYSVGYSITLINIMSMTARRAVLVKLTKIENCNVTAERITIDISTINEHREICYACRNDAVANKIRYNISGNIGYDCRDPDNNAVTYVSEPPVAIPILLFNKEKVIKVLTRIKGGVVTYILNTPFDKVNAVSAKRKDLIREELVKMIKYNKISKLTINLGMVTNMDDVISKISLFLDVVYVIRPNYIDKGKLIEIKSSANMIEENKLPDKIKNAMLEAITIYKSGAKALISNIKDNHRTALKLISNPTLKINFTDPSYGFYDNTLGKWIVEPLNKEESYMVAYDGEDVLVNNSKSFMDFDTTLNNYISVNKDCKVFVYNQLLRAVDSIDLDYFNSNMPSIKFILGVPGAGKTRTILSSVDSGKSDFEVSIEDIGDIVLTTTREAADDIRKRYAVNHNMDIDSKVLLEKFRTGDSYMIHSTYTADNLWIDEGLMRHMGEIFLVAVKAQAKHIFIFGDQAQIPYVNRNASLQLYRSGIENFQEIQVEYLDTSYRCPIDVIARFNYFKYYPFRVYTENKVVDSMSCIHITTPQSIPNEENVVYLTYVQREKVELKKMGYKRVFTVHEFQGNQNEVIYLVRTTTKDYPIHEMNSYMIVAVSRHTKRLVYYTVNIKDKVSKFIKHSVTSGELVNATKMRGGYVATEKLYDVNKSLRSSGYISHPYTGVPNSVNIQSEDYNIIETNSKRIQTFTENKIIRNIVVAHGFPNITSHKYRRLEEIEDCVHDWAFLEQNNTYDLQSIQDYISEAFPGWYYEEDDGYDYSQMELNDWIIDAGGFVIREGLPVKLNYRTCLRPVIKTAIQRRVPNTQRNLVKAFSDRNGNVPDYLGENDWVEVLEEGIKTFIDTYIKDTKTFVSYSENEINVNTKEMSSWIIGQGKDLLEQIGNDETMLFEKELNHYTYVMKGTTKPVLDDTASSRIVSPQTIAFHDKLVNLIFCPIVREMKERFTTVLKDRFIIYSDMSVDEFADKLNKVFPPSMLQYYSESLEIDFSKYDKSQGYFCRILEDRLMSLLGFPKDLLPYWHWAHSFTQLVNLNLKFKANVQFQRKSGDAMTFFGNTLVLMFVLADLLDLNDTYALFSGDDSYIFSRINLRNIDLTLKFYSKFNLEAKLLDYKFPYFCSKFLLPVTETKWVVVPDLVKLLVKIGRKDLVDYIHVEEYRKSLYDLVLPFMNVYINDFVSSCLSDRYGTTTGIDIVLSTLVHYVSDSELFATLYYLRDGEKLLIDPSRPNLDI